MKLQKGRLEGTTKSQEINLALAKRVVRLFQQGEIARPTFEVLIERVGLKSAIVLLAQEAKGKTEGVVELLLSDMELWVMVLMSPKLSSVGFSVLSRKNLSPESARRLLGQIQYVDLKYRDAVRRNCVRAIRTQVA